MLLSGSGEGMGREQRRSQRIESNLAVKVILRDITSGANLAEPLTGTIDDISAHGIRITVPRVRVGGHHLFYHFTDSEHKAIVLEFTLDAESPETISFRVRPVWFDHLLSKPDKPFQLGMEFIEPVDQENLEHLRKYLAEHTKQKGFWSRLFRG